MEKRINKKIETYITSFKDGIRDKSQQMGIQDEKINNILQYIYDYDRLILTKEDLSKRKRVKNVVPFFERCCAKRANNEQCTRRKKKDDEYCGTHLKNKPHGIIDNNGHNNGNGNGSSGSSGSGSSNNNMSNNNAETTQKIEVWAQDIQGICYYIDKLMNVYPTEDIISNKMNPKIIAKYIFKDNIYSIPDFGI